MFADTARVTNVHISTSLQAIVLGYLGEDLFTKPVTQSILTNVKVRNFHLRIQNCNKNDKN